MAFSKDFELEIDSTYRALGSKTTTDFEYQLPYSFPTVTGQTRITLASVYIPESFYNIPQTVLYKDAALFFTVPAGRYTGTQLASALTSSGLTTTYSTSTGKFSLSDPSPLYSLNLGPSPLNPTFFRSLGFSNVPSSLMISSVPTVSDSWASLNLEREQRMYIRIHSFENKMMLPWLPNQYFTFGVPLNDVTSKGVYVHKPSEMRLAQTLYLVPSQLRSNSYLKIQLLWQDGTIVDLNGRNWKLSLKVHLNAIETEMIF